MAFDPTYPERVDIEALFEALIDWEATYGAGTVDTTEDGKLSKSTADAWDAGARGPSTGPQSIQSGQEGEATMVVRGDYTKNRFMFGLTNDVYVSGNSFLHINYGIFLDGNANPNRVRVFEDGTEKYGVGPGDPDVLFKEGDRVTVRVKNGIVLYLLNNKMFYTSTVAPTFPLRYDCTIFDQDAVVQECKTAVWSRLEDVQLAPIAIERGIQGTSYRDRIAATGTLEFQLNNAVDNSGGLLGYYSPNNVNARPGWRIGIRVRCLITYLEQIQPIFYGTIESITPSSGKFGARKVFVTCVDWMDEAARVKVKGIPIQLDKRSDEVFTTLVEAMVNQPPEGKIAQIGGDEYPFALDNAFGEKVAVMTEFQHLAQSEQGFIWNRRDGVQIYEGRHKRPNIFTTSITLTDEDQASVGANRGRTSIVNRAEIQAFPRRVDAAATSILFQFASTPKIERQTELVIQALFRDPEARATRVGGLEMVQPAITTDYLFNSQADGAGTNLTGQLTVSAEYFGNSAIVTVFNGGPEDGFLTKLQFRGKGVYAYESALATADNQPSKDRFGETVLALNMPYQDDLRIAKDGAEFAVNLAKDILTQVDTVTFWANREPRLMSAALQRDISDKIKVEETVIGTAPFVPVGETQPVTPTSFFIQGVRLEIFERGIIRCTWNIVPADPFTYWILERDGFTELDETTRLGYGAFVAGWVLDDSQLGTGTRINE